MEETDEKKPDEDNENPDEDPNRGADSSLSLSITPPVPEDNKSSEKGSEDVISEHLTSQSEGVENDRSFEEIVIDNQSDEFPGLHLSQEVRPDSFVNGTNSSIISLNYLEMNSNEIQPNKSNLDDSKTDDTEENTIENSQTFNVFENLDLDDQSLTKNLKTKRFSLSDTPSEVNFDIPVARSRQNDSDNKNTEILSARSISNNVVPMNVDLESFREMSSNTLSMVSATEYKHMQEECSAKLLECSTVLKYKTDLIEQLSEALEQSVNERRELMTQIDNCKTDMISLQQKLKESSQKLDDHKNKKTENKIVNTEDIQKVPTEVIVEKIDKSIDASNADLIETLQKEIGELQSKLENDKNDYETEINKLRDLLAGVKCGSTEILELKNELEAKHSREVEELRTYFEKKCADLEKNYSEEIFSQHSRKLSGASSEADLNSEVLFSNQPGPAGDNLTFIDSINRTDVKKLKEDLNIVLDKLNQRDLENISDEDFGLLKAEISKCNLRNLFNMEVEDHVKILESKYLDEISNLKYKLDEINRQKMSICTNQEVGSSGEYEITDIIQSYERRLQEQITMAKIDIISALECQIQRLVSNEAEDEEWPSELLILRDRFTDKYELKIQDMREEHEREIEKLKEDHLKVLNGAIERARRRSLRDNESLSKSEIELLKDRDNFKKHAVSYRNFIGELGKYIRQCEDELNNTLVDERIKQSLDRTLNESNDENINLNESSATNSSGSFPNVTRVHLAPNFNDLITLLESQIDDDDSKDISLELKTELGKCLETLRLEANAILALSSNLPNNNKIQNNKLNNRSTNSLEDRLSSLTRQLINETQLKEKYKVELQEALSLVEMLEKEKNTIEIQLEEVIEKGNILEKDLGQARTKIAELIENGHKEIVSEGYGEEGRPILHGLDDTMILLADLQEKARNMLSESRTTADPRLLQMIEELCSVGEKIKEESKKEMEDLLQQVKELNMVHSCGKKVDAADKKYKTTRKFLDEQAMEREQERDESQNEIMKLKEQLKGKNKDKENCELVSAQRDDLYHGCSRELVTKQVEDLEHQLQEMTVQLEDEKKKNCDLDFQLQETIEKIKILREIIRELENQNETKGDQIKSYLETIEKLECIIKQQDRSLEDFKQIDSSENVSDVQKLRKHIENLETELNQLKINSELAGTEGVFKQIKLQVLEFESIIDKKTKDLEMLHSTATTTCSSPSEDMSIRDTVKTQISTEAALEECEIPLQQLARLKEKLVRHSRAEDAAIKRIKDLEMQICTLKTEIEETENEKEYMRKQIQEQLVLISDLQIRLDEQRMRAEHIEKQSNTSLESRIYDLQSEITNLQEKIRNKEKTIINQQGLIEETQKRLKDAENELNSPKEEEIIIQLQKQLEEYRRENMNLKKKISKDSSMVPNIVDNIISDKNNDIEKLKEQLNKTQEILDSYTSLSFDKKDLQTLSNLKNNGTTLQDIICFLDLSNPEQIRRNVTRNETPLEFNTIFKKTPEETVLENNSDPEISAIPKEGISEHILVGKQNSTEIPKKVHFEDVEILRKDVENKDKIIREYEEKLKALSELESKIEKLQNCLDQTEKMLAVASEKFEKEQQELIEREKKLMVELADKKLKLSEKEKIQANLEMDAKRKDDMCLKLSKEKRELEREMAIFKKDSFNNLDRALNEKNSIIDDLKEKLKNMECSYGEIENLRIEIENKNKEIMKLKEEYVSKEDEVQSEIAINDLQDELERLRKSVTMKRSQIKKMESTIHDYEKIVLDFKLQEKNYKTILTDKESDIERLYKDISSIKEEIELKNKITNEKNKEIANLQNLLSDKDRIIAKMTEDIKKLHENLISIQSTVHETGNIIDLSNKLREKQKENATLVQQIHELKAKLLSYESANNMGGFVENITGQLRKELDFSAQMDSNILNALSDHSLSSFSDSADIEIYKKVINKAKLQNRKLIQAKQQLEKEKIELEQNCNVMEGKINGLNNIIEKERLVLQDTQVKDANIIEKLRLNLDSALDAKERLENEIINFKKQTEKSVSSDSTKYKNPPSTETFEISELKKQLSILQTKNKELSEQLEELSNIKLELENNNKYINDLLLIERERNKNLQSKIETMLEKEKEISAQLMFKNLELEEKLKEDRLKVLKNELEEAHKLIKLQKEELCRKVASEVAVQASNTQNFVPETLQARITELMNETRATSKLVQKLENEKRAAELKLVEIRGRNGLSEDLLKKNDYLLAKTLKLESVRKALIWQKRYLYDCVKTHEKLCRISYSISNRLNENNPIQKQRHLRIKFRAGVTAVISIIRMKYLVKRWHSGCRYAKKQSRKNLSICEEATGTNFQVGQPVSDQNFAGNIVNRENDVTDHEKERIETPWSGCTPPSKDRREFLRIGENVVQKEDMTPLKVPQLLAQFAERFDQIQETLGVALESNST